MHTNKKAAPGQERSRIDDPTTASLDQSRKGRNRKGSHTPCNDAATEEYERLQRQLDEIGVQVELLAGRVGHSIFNLVSYGADIKKPNQLEPRTMQSVLLDIKRGAWRDQVCRMRVLPYRSPLQKKAKAKLPFVCWSGTFARRAAADVLQHSGVVGLDLDDLSKEEARRIMHIALDDTKHCMAAFRSASGRGVRLLFRVEIKTAEQHKAGFRTAVEYVRQHYKVEADPSGCDLARASFVSWDETIVIHSDATTLPVIPERKVIDVVVEPPRVLAEPPWYQWLPREFMPYRRKDGGTFYTHRVLLELGKRVALRAQREGLMLTEAVVDAVVNTWLVECQRQGKRLSRTPGEYRDEFKAIVGGMHKTTWFKGAADKWTRWTRHPDFPSEPKARILYAIRQHCLESGKPEFFLSCRDAASVAGCRKDKAAKLLQTLCKDGEIQRIGKRQLSRDAQMFRLVHV
jgi:hypothetical protein